jgi:hypothetical protein
MRRITVTLAAVLALALQLSAQVKFKVLHNFGASNDGNYPSGPLLLDSHGNLYGVTGGGPGLYGFGIAFELIPQKNGNWTETPVHIFNGGSDGAFPWGGLVADSSGNLYGALQGDAGIDVDGVFELTASSDGWTNTVLYSGYAGPGLLLDGLGNVYGPIGQGDYYFSGAIGELSPGSAGWTYTQLYSFCPQYRCPDGFEPLAAPIFDARGNLWGTTWEGGIGRPACADDEEGCGVIYAMTPNGDGT